MALRVRLVNGSEDVFQRLSFEEYYDRTSLPSMVRFGNWLAVDYSYVVSGTEALTVTKTVYGYLEHREGSGFLAARDYERVVKTVEEVAYYRPSQWETVRWD